jgi:hypothetical protein
MPTTNPNEQGARTTAVEELRRAVRHLETITDRRAAWHMATALRLTANAMDFARDPEAGSWFPLALQIARQVNAAAASAQPREDYVPVSERPCQFGCIEGWASAQCEVHGVKAFLAGVLAADPPAAVSAERVEGILAVLTGFGDLDFAVAWASGQSDVLDARASDDGEAEVELVDGRVVKWIAAARQWVVSADSTEQSEGQLSGQLTGAEVSR